MVRSNDGVRHDLHPVKLAGWTAVEWARPLRLFGVLSYALATASGAGYFFTGGTAESVPAWLYLIFGVTALSFVGGMVFFFSAYLKAIRESKAGYTTTARLYPQLPQLDQSGRVLRTPGERAEYLAHHPTPTRG